MSSEEQARRRRQLIERLNAEERHPTREELEEREHQEELEESTRKHPWFYLAMLSAYLLWFGGTFSMVTRHYSQLPLVLGLLVGAVLTHFAFRYLRWVLDNKAKLIWVVALAGVGALLLAQLLILPSSVGGDPTFRGSYGLLLGVVCIAGLRAGYERPYSP